MAPTPRRPSRLAYLTIGFMILAPECRVNSQDVLQRFEAHVHRANGERLPYRLLRPRHPAAGQRYPLVLLLHGAGERGIDNEKQLVHAMPDFASDDVMTKFPAYVVAPQCPEEQQWVDTPWTALEHTMPAEPTAAMRLTLNLIEALCRELPVDERRIYVTGLSMGGFGVWDAVQRAPERFAAALPVCGGGDTALAERIRRVPVWAFHGAQDTVVQPERSRRMVAALEAVGARPRYTEYPDVGHNSWSATYANRELYEWMFGQRRGP